MLRITNLGGFGAGQSAPAVLTALSFVTSAVVNAVVMVNDSIVAPSGIQTGDLLVLYDYKGVTVSIAAPSGFTTITSDATATGRTTISYKIADGTESGTTITGMGGTNGATSMILAVFRGNIPITSVTPASTAEQKTDSAPTNQTVTSGSGTPPLVVIATYENSASGSAISPRGFSPAADGEITTGNTHHFLDYKIYNSSPANITASMGDFGTSNMLASFYLQTA